MLRKVLVLKGNKIIYRREYGETFSWEAIGPLLMSIPHFVKEVKDDVKVDILNTIFYKIAYSTNKKQNLISIIVADINDSDEKIREYFPIFNSTVSEKVSGVAIDVGDLPEWNIQFKEISLPDDIKNQLDKVADQLFRELPPKVAIIGASGVGKTTITALIQNEEIPETHIPTITADVDEIVVGGVERVYLHDTGGQEQFGFLWPRWVKGADGILLVVDSTPANLNESKYFIELIQKEIPKTAVAIIANKQDLPNALPPETIEQKLGYSTYDMVAIDRINREKLLKIVGNLLKLTPRLIDLIPIQVKQDTIIRKQEREIEITPALENEIKAFQEQISDLKEEITQLKQKLKSVPENSEEFHKLNADIMVNRVKIRRLEKEIKRLVMSGGESIVLAYDIHQTMRKVSYVVRCECGNIYKTLVTIKRGMTEVILTCPGCQAVCRAPKESWYELYLAEFPD
ncbi:MAG: ADP-ribosylation factor-like protein [Candidatus Helarchaeota archaeon]